MGYKNSISSAILKMSDCHLVAYATVTMDKCILLYLLLLRRLKTPEKSMLEILGQIHWSNILLLVTISPNSAEWPREYFVTTTIAFITMFDLLFSVILVVSIRKRVLMGFLPWILFRGFITFGLLILGTVFTINDLKGNNIGGLFSSQTQEGNKDDFRKIDIQSINYTNFGVTNLLLLWFFVLFIGWMVILREFKIEAAKTSSKDDEREYECKCFNVIPGFAVKTESSTNLTHQCLSKV